MTVLALLAAVGSEAPEVETKVDSHRPNRIAVDPIEVEVEVEVEKEKRRENNFGLIR